MTVILILACLVIAGAELYMARSARQVADRLTKLEAIALLHDERIQSMTAGSADTAQPGGPGTDRHLVTGTTPPPVTTPAVTTPPVTTPPVTTPPVATPPGTGPQGDGAPGTAAAGAELARLTAESARLRERLGGLEEARDAERRLFARVDGAVESLERVVGEVLRHTVGQLDEAVARTLGGIPSDLDADCGTVRGVVCRAAPGSHDPLVRAYERCARDTGLRIRFQVPGAGEPWHARYYLAGKDPRELERDFLALLGCVHSTAVTPRQTAFQGLLRALGDLRGGGFAQIGPMVAARVPDALLCGVLTLAETRGFDAEALVGEPAAVAGRLRDLPAERVRDLTAWTPPNGSGPGSDPSAAPQP